MRHKITIQNATVARNEYGEEERTLATLFTCRAAVMPQGGREFDLMDQMHGEVTHKITIRYRSGVRPEQRVLFGTRVFQIVSVLNWSEMNRWLILTCVEDADQ